MGRACLVPLLCPCIHHLQAVNVTLVHVRRACDLPTTTTLISSVSDDDVAAAVVDR